MSNKKIAQSNNSILLDIDGMKCGSCVQAVEKILKNHSVKRSIKIAKKLIKNQGRILVRKSGTEPKIRIMGESENKILLKKCIKMISKEFK